jgi:regulator of protease activity HflC (stomatin/prohibitin superfamily)
MLFLISSAAAVVAILVYINAKKRFNKAESTFALIGFLVALAIAVMQCWTIVPAGHVGVTDFFGQVSDKTLKQGINFVNPMASVIKFDARTQEVREKVNVPTKEGLSVEIDISLLFRVSVINANRIYKTDGEDYIQKIIVSQFLSVVRGVTAGYEAKALYTTAREELSQKIVAELSSLLKARGVTIEAAPLRQIKLPAGLTAAIEEKLKAEQESQRMQFILQKETQEAERKRIEAQGIADYQKIVSQGISEQLLRWKGIEATEKLSNSSNAKVIVIGSGKDGLPIILGNN